MLHRLLITAFVLGVGLALPAPSLWAEPQQPNPASPAALPNKAPAALPNKAPAALPNKAPAALPSEAPAALPNKAPLAALPDDAQALLKALPSEGTPLPPRHYFRSNEWYQNVLRQHLASLGGAYVGVGSDQNYTHAALARSELLFLVDYDPRIPWVHRIYSILVPASETPEALVARFDEASREQTLALLAQGLGGDAQKKQILKHYRGLRKQWHGYLKRVARAGRASIPAVTAASEHSGAPSTWLSDPALYDYVRRLFLQQRIVALNADVTGAQTLRAVGEAARRLGVTVRVVYFSNAEQFFGYTSAFLENMRALPTDARSVVLRTVHHGRLPDAGPGDWHYVVHDFTDFLQRMQDGYRNSFALLQDTVHAPRSEVGVTRLDARTGRHVKVRPRKPERQEGDPKN